MTKASLIDMLVVLWMVATIVLLFVFARYAFKSWREAGLASAYQRMKFFNGLVFHHLGNLILLVLFFTKVHRGDISLQMRDVETWTLIIGIAIAVCGVLYKVRVFTDSATELAVTAALTVSFGVLSLFTIYFN